MSLVRNLLACLPDQRRRPITAAWVALVRERNDVEAKGFAVQVAGSHLLVGLCTCQPLA